MSCLPKHKLLVFSYFNIVKLCYSPCSVFHYSRLWKDPCVTWRTVTAFQTFVGLATCVKQISLRAQASGGLAFLRWERPKKNTIINLNFLLYLPHPDVHNPIQLCIRSNASLSSPRAFTPNQPIYFLHVSHRRSMWEYVTLLRLLRCDPISSVLMTWLYRNLPDCFRVKIWNQRTAYQKYFKRLVSLGRVKNWTYGAGACFKY